MDSLDAVFAGLENRDVVFVRPGGNWGDHLIYAGADALGRRRGLAITSVEHARFLTLPATQNTPVYLHGGGGFNPWTSGRALSGFIHAIGNHAGPIIQGPQTIADDPDYLQALAGQVIRAGADKRVYLFARERVSYDNLCRVFNGTPVNIGLDQDTALHMSARDLMPTPAKRKRYRLNALREDNEKTGAEQGFAHARDRITLDPAIYAHSFDHWVRIHAASRSIHTNRTHSAIIGAILGIPTTLFASSSHKNRSIWEYSLESRGVGWVDTPIARPQDNVRPANPSPPAGAAAARRASGIARLKNRVKPIYRVIDLPVLRARMTQRLDRANQWLQRVQNTRHGVPWR